MGLKDKLSVIPVKTVSLTTPTTSPALWHATHILFLILTLLFTLLPAFSGPRTRYWWISITLPVPGSTGGSSWDLGGFGGCKSGSPCSGDGNGDILPVMAAQVKSSLMYHFGVAGMFLLLTLVGYGLMWKPGPRPICAGWTATYILVASPLVVSTPMIVDLIVRSQMLKNDAIESMKTGTVFWLSPAALAMSILWALAIFRLRIHKYRETGREIAAREEKAEKQKRAKQTSEEPVRRSRPDGLRGLWPW